MQGNDLVGLLNTIGDGSSSKIVEFRKLVNDFDGEVKEFEKKQDELTKYVQAYKIPSAEKLEVHKQSIDSLSEKYRRIYSLTKTITESDDIKEKDGIEEFIKAIANCKKLTLQAKVKETCEILERFCRIVPLGKNPDILATYQQDAKTIMEQLSTAADSEIESLVEKAAGPKAFLEAFDGDDEAEEYLDLSEKVREFFGPKIQLLLISKKFEERAPVIAENISVPVEEKAPIEEPTPIKIEESTPAEEIAPAEETIEELAKTEDPEYLEAIFPVKSIEVKASKFDTTFSEFFNFKVNGQIIPAISRFDLLAERHLTKIGNYKENQHVTAKDLEECGKKNLFAIYNHTEDDGTTTKVCCLTKYCREGIQKETNYNKFATRYFRFSYSKGSFTGDNTIQKEVVQKYLYKNDLVFNYFDAIRNHVEEKTFHDIINGVQRKGSSYEVPVVLDNQKINCFMLLNSDDAAECVYKNILIIADIIDIPTTYNDACENAYVVKDGAIYKCDPRKGSIEDHVLEVVTRHDSVLSSGTDVVLKPEEKKSEVSVTEKSTGADKIKSDGIELPLLNESEIDDDVPESTNPSITNLLKLKHRNPTDREFSSIIKRLISEESNENTILQAVLLARAASFEKDCSESLLLFKQLQLATHIFLNNSPSYSSTSIVDAFPDDKPCSREFLLASYLLAMLTLPSQQYYDYALGEAAERYLKEFEETFGMEYIEFKDIFNLLLENLKERKCGITQTALIAIGSEEQQQDEVKNMAKEAEGYLQPIRINTRIKILPEMYGRCFTNKDGVFYDVMCFIRDGKHDSDALEFLKLFLLDYSDENLNIDDDKVSNKIDDMWRAVSQSNFKEALKYQERNRVESHFSQRLYLIRKWIEHYEEDGSSRFDYKLIQLKKELLCAIGRLQGSQIWQERGKNRVLSYAVVYMKDYLNVNQKSLSNLSVYTELLQTGVISLDEKDTPWLDERFVSIKFYEPWRIVLRHISSPKKDLVAVKEEICNQESELFDNVRLLEKIQRKFGEPFDEKMFTEANKYHTDKIKEFKSKMVYAYTYGQINETEKETIENIEEVYKEDFYEVGDYACWRKFLEALLLQKDEIAKKQKKLIHQQLIEKQEKLKDILQNDVDLDLGTREKMERCLDIARRAFEDGNYTVAEEYMNRFERRDFDFDESSDNSQTHFEFFVNQKNYDSVYSLCKKKEKLPLKSFGRDYVRAKLPKDWSEGKKKECEYILENWPSAGTTYDVEAVLKRLGFESRGKVVGSTKTSVCLNVKSTPKNQRSYSHPIAEFGTNLQLLNALCITDNLVVKDLVKEINNKGVSKNSIVLYDGVLSLDERRELAELCHRGNQQSFLFIDRALILYLCTLEKNERTKALLQCSLPFTTYNPFSDGSGAIPDEMFFGRENELADILDLNGTCFVYGGRQLGKTALLQRACSRFNDPNRKTLAVLVAVKPVQPCDVEKFFVKRVAFEICDRLEKISNSSAKEYIQKASTLEELTHGIDKLFEKNVVVEMLLLIDEADDYFVSISKKDFLPILPLVDLRRNRYNKFKFVFAGLHNVCRAVNGRAHNGIFGQMGSPLCVKPLLPTDALHLILEPLKYLGFQVKRYPYLETILANTNYYPGMIQQFGKLLVQELMISKYTDYYHADKGNPPFSLEEHALYTAIHTQAVVDNIKEKFRLSLELDPCYYMLARLITLLHHTEEITLGFTAAKIKKTSDEYDIFCLQKFTEDEYDVLLNEMVNMGILDKLNAGTLPMYRLRRRAFVGYIGNDVNSLFDEIIDENEKAKKSSGEEP